MQSLPEECTKPMCPRNSRSLSDGDTNHMIERPGATSESDNIPAISVELFKQLKEKGSVGPVETGSHLPDNLGADDCHGNTRKPPCSNLHCKHT